MADRVDLEIEFSRRERGEYAVSCRVDYPDNKTLPEPRLGSISIDFVTLQTLRCENRFGEYGALLASQLFDQRGSVLASYQDASKIAATEGTVRFRLVVDDECFELHNLLWETLPDPLSTTGAVLSASTRVFLSRVLRHGSSRQFTLRDRAHIRALVVIANPAPPEGAAYVDSIDTAIETARAEATLGPLTPRILASSSSSPGQASLQHLLDELRHSSYDLLYLACHGVYDPQLADSMLRMEASDGSPEFVSGKALITSFERLPNPPTLVVLCSCQSAGSGRSRSEELIAAIGPRLVQAGVPAVIAMQGNFTVSSAKVFFPPFFKYVLDNGIVDQAFSLARQQIETEPDYFVPVLFHRLKTGRVWYGSNEQATSQDNIGWDAHVQSLRNGQSVVIVGSALLEPYIGSQAALASQLARRFRYPFADSETDDLALVCQYLDYIRGRNNLELDVCRECLHRLIAEYRDLLFANGREPDVENVSEPHVLLQQLLKKARERRASGDLHKALAALPFKAYISANPDGLLEEAFGASRSPRILRSGVQRPWVLPDELSAKLTPDSPLLAYIYGSFDDTSTLVLTEHDFYMQLTSAASGEAASTKYLNTVFTSSALIFLGFRLHEWDFRILYRRLQLIPGWESHKRFLHVAVQVDPSTTRGTGGDTVVAKYVDRFLESTQFEIFHGSATQFLTKLREQHLARGGKLYGSN